MKTIAKALAGVGMLIASATSQADVELRGGGSTYLSPICRLWIAEYEKTHPDVRIDYAGVGSGGGIKSIIEKTFDFAGSDYPMNADEVHRSGGSDGIVEVPAVGGAVVLIYNLPGLNGELKLDGPTLAEIYLGDIRKWNDPKIVALNPGGNLPDLPIMPVHRNDGSGTTIAFTNYLASQSQKFKEHVGAGKSVEWPVGSGAPQSGSVSPVVLSTKGGIGYIEMSYAMQNNLPFALIRNMNQPGEKTYPISSFTYIIVHKDLSYLKDPANARALVDFLRWATSDGEKLSGELSYTPLSDAVKKKVQAALDGLTWEGKPVNPAVR